MGRYGLASSHDGWVVRAGGLACRVTLLVAFLRRSTLRVTLADEAVRGAASLAEALLVFAVPVSWRA